MPIPPRRFVLLVVAAASALTLATLAIPSFDHTVHPGACGSAAINTLRGFAAVQAQPTVVGPTDPSTTRRSLVERVHDAAPWMGELSGAVRSGYRFRVGTLEAGSSPGDHTDPELASFVVHAWPESEATQDDRIFLLDARGVVWTMHDPAANWRGPHSAPPADCGTPFNGSSTPHERTDAHGAVWTRVPTLAEINATLR